MMAIAMGNIRLFSTMSKINMLSLLRGYLINVLIRPIFNETLMMK